MGRHIFRKTTRSVSCILNALSLAPERLWCAGSSCEPISANLPDWALASSLCWRFTAAGARR
jgi:hypothetical protein